MPPETTNTSLLPLAGQLHAGGFSQAHPELCPEHGAHLRLLVLVMSALANKERRDAVRLTWGHYAVRRDVALAFVLGTPTPDVRAQLAAEDALYGDIIVGNFIDSHWNISLKVMSILEWTERYCERAPRLLKVHDDVFLNVPLLLSFVAKRANETRTIWGRMWHKKRPNRTLLSHREFKGNMLPTFAAGPGYLLTSDCVTPLLATARIKTYLKLENVFFTDIVARELGIKKVNAPEFYNQQNSITTCKIRSTISTHNVQYHKQFEYWQKLLDGRTKC